MNNKENKAFLFLVLIGLFTFAACALFIQNINFTDGSTHLLTVEDVIENKDTGYLPKFYDFPVYYLYLIGMFALFGLGVNIFVAKIATVVLFITSITAFYFLSKQVFPKKWPLPLAFLCTNYWVLVFSSVNYVGILLMFWVISFFYLFLIEYKGNSSNWNYAFMLVFALLGAFTKQAGTYYFPFLMISMLVLFFVKRKLSYKTAGLAFLVGIPVVARFVFISSKKFAIVVGMFSTYTTSLIEFLQLDFVVSLVRIKRGWLELFRFPSNVCLNQKIFGKLILPVQLLFLFVTTGVLLPYLYGFYKSFKSKERFWIPVALLSFLGCLTFIGDVISRSWFILPRYIIPVFPLIGLVVAKGFEEIKNKPVKKVLVGLFVIYCVYSVVYTLYLANYYRGVNSSFEPAALYIEGLPADKEVCGQGYTIIWGRHFISKKVGGCRHEIKDYIWASCYKEQMDWIYLRKLEDLNKIVTVFEDSCNSVFKVNDFNLYIENYERSFFRQGLEGYAATSEQNDEIKKFDDCH